MAKYHINRKGDAALCRAKTKCPLGDDSPHFESKQAAEDYIEQALKAKHYAFGTTSRAANEFQGMLLMLSEEEEEGKYGDSKFGSVEAFVRDGLRDEDRDNLRFLDQIDAPDYLTHVLIEKDGNYFTMSTTGGEYSVYEVLGVNQVRRETKEQIVATSIPVEDTSDHPEVNAIFQELGKIEPKPTQQYGLENIVTHDAIHVGASPDKTYQRTDGSKIVAFNIDSPGDRSFSDEPDPVLTDVDFDENGHRQNAREMDRGYCVYDTRSQVGVLFKQRTGSEGSSQSGSFEWNGSYIHPQENQSKYGPDVPGHIYVIEATGETHQAPFYKIV